MKLWWIIPTVPESKELLDLCTSSLNGLGGDLVIRDDSWQDSSDKIWDAWQEVIRDAGDEDVAVVLHHDTVLHDHEVFRSLLTYFQEGRYTLAGASESNGKTMHCDHPHFMNTHFLMTRPKAIGAWFPQHWIPFSEPYWAMQRSSLDRAIYLDMEWHAPRIGHATELVWDGERFLAHLWRSVDRRVARDMQSIHGIDLTTLRSWREQFTAHWRKKLADAA